MPGFGESPSLNGTPPAPAALASAVHSFLGDIGVERYHVAGCSLGGWVALELAHAGHALSVAGLCTAGLWAKPLAPRQERARRSARLALPLLPLITRSARGRRLALGSVMTRPERVPPAAARALIRSYALSPAMPEASRLMRASRFEQLAAIDVSVTLAWAEFDGLVSPPRSVPDGVRTVELPGCGHVPMWDDPELIARVLLDASGGA